MEMMAQDLKTTKQERKRNEINTGNLWRSLVPISECDCLDYLREITSSAERLIQLTKEREEMK
jgi:hypothetical protein